MEAFVIPIPKILKLVSECSLLFTRVHFICCVFVTLRGEAPPGDGGEADGGGAEPDGEDERRGPRVRHLGRVVEGVRDGPVPAVDTQGSKLTCTRRRRIKGSRTHQSRRRR